jgi:hypothetical protein
MVARRCDALLGSDDVEGLAVWNGILRAIEECLRVERKVGERVN